MKIDEIEQLSLSELNSLVTAAEKRRVILKHEELSETTRMEIEHVFQLPHGFDLKTTEISCRDFALEFAEKIRTALCQNIDDHYGKALKRNITLGDVFELLIFNGLPISYFDSNNEIEASEYLKWHDDNGRLSVELDRDFMDRLIRYRTWQKSHHTRMVKDYYRLHDAAPYIAFKHQKGADDE